MSFGYLKTSRFPPLSLPLVPSTTAPSPVASGGNASGNSSVDEWGANSGSAADAPAALAAAVPLASSTSPTAAAAAAAAAFEGAEDHHGHDDHLAADLGLDGVSWPWEGGGDEGRHSLAALKTTAAGAGGASSALPLAPSHLAVTAAAAATNSGGSNSNSGGSGVASQSQWTTPSSGGDPGHGASVSPRSEAGGSGGGGGGEGGGGTPTTAHEAAGASAAGTAGGAFYLPNPMDAAVAAAPPPPAPYSTAAVPLPFGVSATGAFALGPSSGPAPAGGVLSQLGAQHRSLLSPGAAAPVAGYRSAAASSSAAGLFAHLEPRCFDFAAPSSAAALAARAAFSTVAHPPCPPSAAAGPSVPDIPDAWAAAALCDELVDLGAHPGAHRGDPWRRRSLSFGDLAAAEAAALACAAAASAAAAAAAHVAETGHAAETAAMMRRLARPATAGGAAAVAAAAGGNSKRRFSNVGGRNSIEQQRFGGATQQQFHHHLPLTPSEAELAALLPLSALDDCDEGAESDSGWTPAVAAARRRFESERGEAAARQGGGRSARNDFDEAHLHPAPPVAPPQIKRARSVSCLSSHGVAGGGGGLLPLAPAVSKATAEGAAASKLHRDEALMFASMRMMKTSSPLPPPSPAGAPSSSPATAAASSSPSPSPAPAMPRQLPPRLQSQGQKQQRNNTFSSSSGGGSANAGAAGSPHSAATAAAAAAALPSSLPPQQQTEQEGEEANPQNLVVAPPHLPPPPPPPPGFWLTAPPIPKERGVQPDEVCWARLLSYPWWPAVVRSPPPPSALALRRKPESVFVVFFGDGNCAWLNPRSLDRFASGYGKRSAKPRKDLQKAVDEAWRALGVERPGPAAAAGDAGAGAGDATGDLALPEGFDESRPALAPQHF